MNARLLPTALLAACLAAGALAAEDTAPPTDEAGAKAPPKDSVRALLLEDARTLAAKAASPAPAAKAESKANPPGQPAAATPATTPAPKDAPATPAANAKPTEPATMLPQVEVNKSRITELDRQIHEQDKDIAREQKNAKPTELDKALNDTKVSNALSVLGGQSADYRAGLAKERVDLLQDERDILEQMKLAKTKAEKDELQKELDEIRGIRRDLEKNLR